MVGVVHVVLGRSIVEEFTFFQELFTQLFHILTDKANPQKVDSISEECKKTSLAAVSLLIQNSGDSVRQKVYGDTFRPQLGHAVYITLKLAQEEKNRSLKIQAMETLSALGQQKTFHTLSSQDQNLLSYTFANFLPGIVLALTKVATADEKQGHKVTAVAIDAWSYFVMLVMRDKFLEEHTPRLGESEAVSQLRKQLFGQDQEKGKKRELPSKDNKFVLPEPEEEVSSSKLQNVEITSEWIHKTSGKLMLLVQSLAKLVIHTHWRVRLSLVHWAQQLICKCSRSLAEAIVMAVEVIVGLRSDDMVDVGTAAQDAMLTVTQALEFKGEHTQTKQVLLELLEERVYALSTQLPTICRQQDDSKTLTTVRKLLGSLEVLGERLAQIMAWPGHSHRLLQSFSFALTLDVTDSDLLLERTLAQDPFEVLTIKPSLGKGFRYFQDLRILEAIGTACHLIGFHSNMVAVIDLCLDILQQSTHHQKEALLLLTLIIQGRDERKYREKDRNSIPQEEGEQVVQSVLEVIMCQDIFNAPLYVLTQSNGNTGDAKDIITSLVPVNKQKNVSIELIKSNIVLVANTLNLISVCARMMGTNFVMFLSKVLCSVMEKAGEANVLVGHTAANTLKEIALSCKYKNVAELIEKSVPQFWYPLSMRLKRLPQYPSAPLVLQVSLEYANIDVMAFTEELVEDVLSCLDTYHNNEALPLLRVLLVYVTAVVRYASKTEVVEKDFESVNEMNEYLDNRDRTGKSEAKQKGIVDNVAACDNYGPVALFLDNYHKDQVKVKQGIEGSDSFDVNEHEDDSGAENFKKQVNQQEYEDGMSDNIHEENDEKKKVPKYIELVVNIMERCSHMLYLQDRKIKILIMEVVKAGCTALTQWEDQRLPVCHKLWKPLVLRLKDSDFVVMICALEVLSVMVVSSGGFLRRRTMKEVFPPLLSFLRSQSHTSLGKTKGSGYYMTAAYRAQKILLRTLPSLIRSLMLTVDEMSDLVNVLMLYLDSRQPTELCRAGITLVKQVAQSHPHHVWLALAHQQSPVRIIPPAANLATLKINGAGKRDLPQEVLELYKQLS
ncbi:TELO2-interacting protein 1 homolog [Homarus americanus]|nr:TELO2-interacting protein 1 homolog [Homarus americanus]